MSMKIKALQNAISDVSTEKNTAVIKFATYSSRDRDKDKANPGMFSKSWQEFKDVRLFKNHDKLTGPGKILKLWDDQTHAYSSVKFGTHTEGQDLLKQVQEEIVTDSSYLMYPIKWTSFGDGGMNITEAFHKEVSLLTHWGSHPESKVASVAKSLQDLEVNPEIQKQLNADEIVFLRNNVAAMNTNLSQLVTFAAGLSEGSDLYTWLNDIISSVSYQIQRFKNQLVWGQKSWNEEELKNRLVKLKSFAKNSTASDECIQSILKEAGEIEDLLLISDTEAAVKALQQSAKPNGDEQLKLLNLKLLLQR